MNTLGYTLLGALGVAGTYFGVKSLTRSAKPDDQNIGNAQRRFNNILTDTLASPGLALPNNFNNPATASFLNSNQGLQLMNEIYAGNISSTKGDRIRQEDRQWLTTAAARNNTDVLNLLRPVQYASGTAPYQPFGNYPAFDQYGYYAGDPANSFGYPGYPQYDTYSQNGYGYGNQYNFSNPSYGSNSSYGYGGYGNQVAGYGNPMAAYTGANNNSYYANPYPNFGQQYSY